MCDALSDAWQWLIAVEPTDNFTVIVRKIICMIIGISSLFGGACPYYAFRALNAGNRTATGGEDDGAFVTSFVILSATLAVFCVCSLFVAIYCRVTKTAPDWLMYLCIIQIALVTIAFDVITRFPFPVRSTSIALSIVAIGSGLPQSRLIVIALLLYMIANEVRDAWAVRMRIESPYEGGPIEKFGFSLTGIFSLVACAVLMGGMVFEYTTLLSAARSSVQLANTVAQLLLSYDTDAVRDELDAWARQNGIDDEVNIKVQSDGDGGGEGDAAVAEGDGAPEGGQKRLTPSEVAARQREIVDDNRRKARANESAKELIEVFRDMAKNLDLYRPHLPDYVLPKSHNDEDDEYQEDNEGETDQEGEESQQHQQQQGSTFAAGAGRGQRRKSVAQSSEGGEDDDPDLRGNISMDDDGSSMASDRVSSASGSPSPNRNAGAGAGAGIKYAFGGRPPTVAAFGPSTSSGAFAPADTQSCRMTEAGMTAITGFGGARGGGGRGGGAGGTAAQRKKLTVNFAALSNRSGSHLDNVIVARIDLGRFIDALCEHLFGAGCSEAAYGRTPPTQATLTKRINVIIERVLESAAALDGTVHAVVDDSVLVSWNATRRVAAPESKCVKFMLDVRAMAGEMLEAAGALPVSHSSLGIYGGGGGNSAPIAGSSGGTGTGGMQQSGGGAAFGTPNSKLGSGGSVPAAAGGGNSSTGIAVTSVGSGSGSTGSRTPGTPGSRSPASRSPGSAPLANTSNAAGGLSDKERAQREREREREEALTALQRLITGAAVVGSAWCQIGGGDKKQMFLLSRFSHTHVLSRASELALANGFFVCCPKIYTKVRFDFMTQGCGAVNAPIRTNPSRPAGPGIMARRRSNAGSPASPLARATSTGAAGAAAPPTFSITPPAALRSVTPPLGDGAIDELTRVDSTPDFKPLKRGDTLLPRRDSSLAKPPSKENSLEDGTGTAPPDRRASTSTQVPAAATSSGIGHQPALSASSGTTAATAAGKTDGEEGITLSPSGSDAALEVCSVGTPSEKGMKPAASRSRVHASAAAAAASAGTTTSPPVAPLTATLLAQQQQMRTSSGGSGGGSFGGIHSPIDAADQMLMGHRSPSASPNAGNIGLTGSFGQMLNMTGSFGALLLPPTNASMSGGGIYAGNSFSSNLSFGGGVPNAPMAEVVPMSPLFKREAVGLFELVGAEHKDGTREHEDNEWLYALGSGRQARDSLSDAVQYIARADYHKARVCLDKLARDLPDVNRISRGAYSSVMSALHELQQVDSVIASAAGATQQQHEVQQQLDAFTFGKAE